MIDEATFQSVRPRLFSLAYRMLGSAADAEDVVQDAWLRASAAPADLESARSWLTTVVTRLCLDRLKSARARREEYPGVWLPEPVPTETIETAEDVAARRESVTLAFLVLLETLTPAERAAFLLREVFDRDYAEVAGVLATTPAAARQLVHRAKARLAEGRPRFDAPPDRQREIVARFFDAVREGDLAGLEHYLAADVVFSADGGGRASAARHPIIGAEAVGRLIGTLWRKASIALDPLPTPAERGLVDINGEPALVARRSGRIDSVFVFSTDADRIWAINVIRNPDKLVWLAAHAIDRGSSS
jgi:RNA polymerase sigma-70 factor (ECF subfamily)